MQRELEIGRKLVGKKSMPGVGSPAHGGLADGSESPKIASGTLADKEHARRALGEIANLGPRKR